ncbi:MAG: GNAT family N-acetyltransferase [Bdellovibrionota bacterium]
MSKTLRRAPSLETERLVLRSHEKKDYEACTVMWSDPVVTRYIGGKPSTAQQTWLRLLNYIGHWALMGFGYWAVEEKLSGRFIGEVGFADFKRNLDPSVEGLPEIGWALVSQSHGKGYAVEALQAIVAWGDAYFKQTKTICIINPENAASIRLAKKLGYQELKRTSYAGEPTILFSRDIAP